MSLYPYRSLYTPEMRGYLKKQSKIAELLATVWQCQVSETGIYSKALIDAELFRWPVKWAITEIKTRNGLTLKQLTQYGDALFTAKKIDAGIAAAKILGVPYLAVLYLPRDKEVFWWKVANEHGKPLLEMRRDRTPVYQPMIGEEEMQDNIYLPVSAMQHVTVTPDWIPPWPEQD
jgi:hypothetical protein